MTKDDLKVWALHMYLKKLEPLMANLLNWMEEELTARLRSGAVIRRSGPPSRSSVHTVTSNNRDESYDIPSQAGSNRSKQHQWCYVCRGRHYVDQCARFKAMIPDERWKVVKEQRGCFSCLKSSKGHTSANCMRKEECKEKRRDGIMCKNFHHKLLHIEHDGSEGLQVSSVQDASKTILP